MTLTVCIQDGCARLIRTGSRCDEHRRSHQRDINARRPSPAERGYDAAWTRKSKAFLATHTTCIDCGRPSQQADHNPSRAALLAQGVLEPDQEQYLVARCKSCHSKKTNREDGGGWPNRSRSVSG